MRILIYRNGGIIEGVTLVVGLAHEVQLPPDEWDVVDVNDAGEEILDPDRV